jgi:hypothetical protein
VFDFAFDVPFNIIGFHPSIKNSTNFKLTQ